MGVALLLITHDEIGRSMLDTAINMMGVSPSRAETWSLLLKWTLNRAWNRL